MDWLLRLRKFRIARRGAIVATLIFVGTPAVVIATVLLIPAFHDASPSGLLVESPTERTIVGFIGGTTKAGPLKAFFRTSRGEFGFVPIPEFSGCHDRDRIFLTESRIRDHISFVTRQPLCRRAGARISRRG